MCYLEASASSAALFLERIAGLFDFAICALDLGILLGELLGFVPGLDGLVAAPFAALAVRWPVLRLLQQTFGAHRASMVLSTIRYFQLLREKGAAEVGGELATEASRPHGLGLFLKEHPRKRSPGLGGPGVGAEPGADPHIVAGTSWSRMRRFSHRASAHRPNPRRLGLIDGHGQRVPRQHFEMWITLLTSLVIAPYWATYQRRQLRKQHLAHGHHRAAPGACE